LAGEPAARQPHPRRELEQLDLHARKRLGQHFLTDSGVLHKITRAAEISPQDTVIEVGPGLGILTAELLPLAGRVIAIELDDNLAAALKDKFRQSVNLTVINEDILKLDPATLLVETGATSYKVVANLPYYITSAALRYFLEASPRPTIMVVMVQREVARAITAPPGDMSLLALSVQLYGKPQIISRVPAGAFYPVPEVESAVLKVTLYPQPVIPAGEITGFFRLARAGFCAARKQIMNSLTQGLDIPKDGIISLLAKADIDSRRRAETLNLMEWARLWGVFKEVETNSNNQDTSTKQISNLKTQISKTQLKT
jgi:16S rRNA (adenine1518-N6/adenine1519-N6)-dimethyltransferase